MNHTTVTPENQVSRQDAWQQAQDSHTDHATAEKAYHHQAGLVYDLKELYALVNVCRLALQDQGQDETDSAASVLMLVTNRLFEVCEKEQTREKALEAIAYPDRNGGADHE